MKQTPNYNLNKPDYTDVADIKELNTNMDILDRIIKGISDGQFTVEEAKRLFSQIEHNHDDTYLGKTAKASDSELLDGLDSTAFLRSYMGNGTLANDLGVAKELRWKNYGNGHTIFDASNGTTPSGRVCNNTNPEIGWSATYPTLMGWNGANTYGVRVSNAGWADGAHNANNVQGFQFRNNNGRLEVLVGGEWLPVGGKNYYINRTMALAQHLQAFEYSGSSGVIRGITAHHNTYFGNQDMINKFNAGTWTGHSFIVVWLDGVMLNNDMSAYSIQCDSGRYFLMGVEFKHSIKVQVFIRHTSGYFNVGVHIQTEK